jgi:hypothetical protein
MGFSQRRGDVWLSIPEREQQEKFILNSHAQ